MNVKPKAGKSFIALAFLIIVALVVIREWFLPYLPRTHDAEVHISRAAAFARSLAEGNALPRWASYFNWSYGTPSIMFLYPGIPYVSALLHLLTGLTFIDIYKLLMVTSYVGSGVLWYGWIRRIGMSRFTATASGLFYLLAPYRLVNIFVRGALAEHIGFLFFPLLMLAATNVLDGTSKKRVTFLSLSIAGIILAHNLSALLYLPLVFLYPFIFTYLNSGSGEGISGRMLLRYFGAVALGLSLAAFFWLPALVESRYTLSSWLFSTRDWYADHFLTFGQLVWSPWGYGWSLPGTVNDGMTFQIGIAWWSVLVVGLALIVLPGRAKIKPALSVSRQFAWLMAGFFLVVVGMTFSLPISQPLWRSISLLPKFQFPWRFLSFIVIGSSLVAASVSERFKRLSLVRVSLLLLPVLTTFSFWRIGGPSDLTEQFLTVDYVGTSDTGETTPVWAVRFQGQPPKQPVEVVSSEGTVGIFNLDKRMERHEFSLTATAASVLVDNTLYFPGWKVYVDGQQTPIEYQDQNWRGLITFPVATGTHRVAVVFSETLLRKLANSASILAIGVLVAQIRRRKRTDLEEDLR